MLVILSTRETKCIHSRYYTDREIRYMRLMKILHMGQLNRCFCEEKLQNKTQQPTFSTVLFPPIFSILVIGTIKVNAYNFLSLYHLQIKIKHLSCNECKCFKKPIICLYTSFRKISYLLKVIRIHDWDCKKVIFILQLSRHKNVSNVTKACEKLQNFLPSSFS